MQCMSNFTKKRGRCSRCTTNTNQNDLGVTPMPKCGLSRAQRGLPNRLFLYAAEHEDVNVQSEIVLDPDVLRPPRIVLGVQSL